MRYFLCSLLIRVAQTVDELHSTFMDARLITDRKKRNKAWLDAIKRGEYFKKGDWTKDTESVVLLSAMDEMWKDLADSS
jgi:hypothetical protein